MSILYRNVTFVLKTKNSNIEHDSKTSSWSNNLMQMPSLCQMTLFLFNSYLWVIIPNMYQSFHLNHINQAERYICLEREYVHYNSRLKYIGQSKHEAHNESHSVKVEDVKDDFGGVSWRPGCPALFCR